MSRHRNWVFTINNYTEEDLDALLRHEALPDFVWLCCGIEEAPTTGTAHVQGACCLMNAKTLTACQKTILPGRPKQVHLEVMRGRPWQAREYIVNPEKESSTDWWEIGRVKTKEEEEEDNSTKSERGNSVWQRCWAQVALEGKSVAQLMLTREFGPTATRMATSLLKLEATRDRMKSPKWRTVKTSVLFGKAGSGKTRKAMEAVQGDDWFKLNHPGDLNVWWDGYNGQSVLILDDFTGWLPLTQLLGVLDGYPMQVQVKFGTAQAAWTEVIITSNEHPSKWYKPEVLARHDGGQALRRRIDEIWEVVDGEEREGEWILP